jgi:uroporphyrin-3 C-methyltransferase
MTQPSVDEAKPADPKPTTAPASAAPKASTAPTVSTPPVVKRGGWLAGVALIVAIGAIAFSAVNWKNSGGLRAAVGERVQAAEAESAQLRRLSSDTAMQLNAAQARVTALEQRVSELNLQRTQLEELMLSVSRSRDDTLVQDLISSLRFAAQQSQLTGTTQPNIAALQAGIERIESAANPRLSGVRDAMRQDLTTLQGAANSDVSVIVRQLAVLSREVDNLQMRDTAPPPVLQPRPTDKTVAATGVASPDEATDQPSGLIARAQVALTMAWDQVWSFAKNQGQDLIRIRAAQPSDDLMVTPEAAVLVKANLKLQLLTARVALMSGQKATAAEDIAAVLQNVTRLTDPMSAPVQRTVDGLQKAQAAIAALYVPSPQASLSALTALAVTAPGR